MTDRTSELVAEFSREMDARTYDQKMAVVIERMDSRFDHLVYINEELVKVVSNLVERIIFLENRLSIMDEENAILKEREQREQDYK